MINSLGGPEQCAASFAGAVAAVAAVVVTQLCTCKYGNTKKQSSSTALRQEQTMLGVPFPLGAPFRLGPPLRL